MGIINLKQSKVLEGQIDEFLDTVSRASLVFRDGIKQYMDREFARFEEAKTRRLSRSLILSASFS